MDAQVLEVWAKSEAEAEMNRSGRVSDLEPRIRQRLGRFPKHYGDRLLEEYRVVTHHTEKSYEVRIEPRHWAICRPTRSVTISADR